MRLTVTTKVLSLAVAGLLLVLAVGGIGLRGTRQVQGAQSRTLQAADAVRAERSTDAARSAVRADALAALLARTPAERQQVLDDLGRDAGLLRAGLDDVRKAGLGRSADAAVAASGPRVEAFVSAAQRVVTLSDRTVSDPSLVQARAALVRFETASDQLSEVLPAVASAIADSGERARADARRTTSSSTVLTLLVTAVAALLLCGSAALLAVSVRRRVAACLDAASALADKDLTRDVELSGSDELVDLGVALGRVRDVLRDAVGGIAAGSGALAAAAEELTVTSASLTEGARLTADRAAAVAASAGQVQGSTQEAADSTAAMSGSIRDISDRSEAAGRVAGQAVELAGATQQTVLRLQVSSGEIGSVVQAITTIAEQTNMLALNATIEAARAGEAGKGFAVVAGEVKELSRGTASATADIGRRVAAIQADAQQVALAIDGISAVIAEISGAQGAIGEAVARQHRSTGEITSSVQDAAEASSGIAGALAEVAEAAAGTTSGAGDTSSAAAELSRLAADLQGLVAQFRTV